MLKPLGDTLIVKRIKPPDKTTGGLHLPDTAQKKGNRAEVLAVGPGRYDGGRLIPVCARPAATGDADYEAGVPLAGVRAGDVIVFGDFSGLDFKHEDEEYTLLKSEDVLAVHQADPPPVPPPPPAEPKPFDGTYELPADRGPAGHKDPPPPGTGRPAE